MKIWNISKKYTIFSIPSQKNKSHILNTAVQGKVRV